MPTEPSWNITENTAKVNFHYAVKKLRELLVGGSDAQR